MWATLNSSPKPKAESAQTSPCFSYSSGAQSNQWAIDYTGVDHCLVWARNPMSGLRNLSKESLSETVMHQKVLVLMIKHFLVKIPDQLYLQCFLSHLACYCGIVAFMASFIKFSNLISLFLVSFSAWGFFVDRL